MMLEETISCRVMEIASGNLGGGILHTLKRGMLDSYVGICASLRDTEMLRKFLRLSSGPASGADISVWGIGRRANAVDAVFMNSILSRRSDLLNSYISPSGKGGAHPSDNVALLLTMGDWRGMSGGALLQSIYVAFYLLVAYCNHYDPQAAGYDHDALTIFSTALAIGQVMGLTREQLTETQRIAGMLGLTVDQSARGVINEWRHCTFASCAMRGLQAVRMALAGFHGPPEIYEGTAGMDRFIPHAGTMFDPEPDLTRIVFKRWPAYVFCQTPIDVALDLSTRIKDPREIASVLVDTYSIAFKTGASTSAYHPMSRAGRTHSIPYSVAAALLKPIEYEDFDDDCARNPALIGLMKKIKVVEDKKMTEAYPGKASCRITVKLKDGSTVKGERDRPKGDPLDPLSDQELEDKLRTYYPSGDSREQDEVIGRLWNLEKEENLDRLLTPLKRKRV